MLPAPTETSFSGAVTLVTRCFTVTEQEALTSGKASMAQVMTQVPGATGVITPLPFTFATLGSLDIQVTLE